MSKLNPLDPLWIYERVAEGTLTPEQAADLMMIRRNVIVARRMTLTAAVFGVGMAVFLVLAFALGWTK